MQWISKMWIYIIWIYVEKYNVEELNFPWEKTTSHFSRDLHPYNYNNS